MKSFDNTTVKSGEKNQMAFSAITTAAHLLLKLKKKIKIDCDDMYQNRKENFNLSLCLSKTSLRIEYELDQMRKELEEKPQIEMRDLLLFMEGSHFNEFLQSLLNYFKVFL